MLSDYFSHPGHFFSLLGQFIFKFFPDLRCYPLCRSRFGRFFLVRFYRPSGPFACPFGCSGRFLFGRPSDSFTRPSSERVLSSAALSSSAFLALLACFRPSHPLIAVVDLNSRESKIEIVAKILQLKNKSPVLIFVYLVCFQFKAAIYIY